MRWGVRKKTDRSAEPRISAETKQQIKKEVTWGSITPIAMLLGAGPPLSVALTLSVRALQEEKVRAKIASTSVDTAKFLKDYGSTKLAEMREPKADYRLIEN